MIEDPNFYTFDDVLIAPAYSEIESRQTIDTSVGFLGINLQIPIISANMDYVTGPGMVTAMHNAGGMGILNRFAPWEEQLRWMDEIDVQNIPFVFSVGIRDINESFDRIEQVKNSFPNLFAICIDVAHGHHKKVADLTKKVKSIGIRIIAGNVATYDGAEFLADAGADVIKCGIGAGAVCTTRTVAGVGIPQLSAIREVVEGARGRPVISDGGIRGSADISKALIAGATAVMIGSLIAGASECPSPTVVAADGRRYRPYRGQSIFGSNGERYVREGIEGYVTEKGPVEGILKNLQAGLRSSMSYVGANNIKELREKGKFIIVTSHTQAENSTRVVEAI